MIPRECKRLIEVDFPIARVSYYAAREKSIRHGHPSTLHLWWARRPLASCRAVLLGLLLPDPADPHCPAQFKEKARSLLAQVPGAVRGLATQGARSEPDKDLRKALLTFIGDFANWDVSADPLFLKVSRGLVKAAHPEETPLVVDPFAGGGSIPLEALRLGCEAFASDLNPVACLILKVLLEDIPRHGAALAKELREAGARIKEEAEKELAEFYPKDPDGAQPIAYLWARTVRCEAPHCGAEIPLMRSFWLCKKVGRKVALRPRVERPSGQQPRVEFEIFSPSQDREVSPGTVSRAKARCLACGMVLSPERVRTQLAAQKGGADVIFDDRGQRLGGARLLAVVTTKPNQRGRFYRLPQKEDYQAVFSAIKALALKTSKPFPGGLAMIPDEPTPAGGGSGAGRAFSVQRYGMMQWGDLFTARQKLAILVFTEKVRHHRSNEITAIAVSRFIDDYSSLCRWMLRETPAPTFTRQALPILWDFCETWPFDEVSWSLPGSFTWVEKYVESVVNRNCKQGQVHIADACNHPLPNESVLCFFTDPPYYDAVPYADLSDFFFVWLKRMLLKNNLMRDPFNEKNILTPKSLEIVQDEVKEFDHLLKDLKFFEERMACALKEGRRTLRDDGVGCIVFAHKSTEGWEALLSGIILAGWEITASWPIHTERAQRPRAHESAALATSIHLVCRPRSSKAGVGDWAEVKTEMETRVQEWMRTLVDKGIRGADAIFSCIGPAMEVYSRYAQVQTPAGLPVPLGGDPEALDPHQRGFLAYVFEAVSREALRQVLGEAETEGFEEDARLTALFLWTLQSTRLNGNGQQASGATEDSGEEEEPEEEEEKPAKAKGGLGLPFDTFIRITRPMGIHYQEWEKKIIDIDKGVVRLLPVLDRQEALFGDALQVQVVELKSGPQQGRLFTEEAPTAARMRRGPGKRLEDLTTLDRVHQAMLLFAAGQTVALKNLLEEERRQGKRFERLAFALTPLYPAGIPERRWLEGIQGMMRMR